MRGIPTLVLMDAAKERDRVVGALNTDALRRWVEQRLPVLSKDSPGSLASKRRRQPMWRNGSGT